MSHVFISYYHEDEAFADRTIERVRSALGFDCWKDTEQIRAGEDEWFKQIESAIRNAFALVIIATPESLERPYVKYEWAFALGAGVSVIPLEWASFPAGFWDKDPFKRLRMLQARRLIGDDPDQWQQLFRDLEAARSKKSGAIIAPPGASAFIRNAVEDLNGTDEARWHEAIKRLEGTEDSNAALILRSTAEGHHTRFVRHLACFAHVNHTKYHDVSWPAIREAALQTESVSACHSAWKILGDFGGPQAAEILTEALHKESVTERRKEIIEQLGRAARAGDTGALPILIEHWRRISDVHERKTLIVALRHFRTTDAAEFLLQIAPDQRGENLKMTIRSLVMNGTETATEGIKKLVRGSDDNLRIEIIGTLGMAGALGHEGSSVALQVLDDLQRDRWTVHVQRMISNSVTHLQKYLHASG